MKCFDFRPYHHHRSWFGWMGATKQRNQYQKYAQIKWQAADSFSTLPSPVLERKKYVYKGQRTKKKDVKA
jgi:hypothetical protein